LADIINSSQELLLAGYANNLILSCYGDSGYHMFKSIQIFIGPDLSCYSSPGRKVRLFGWGIMEFIIYTQIFGVAGVH
jgi:hypothetical protein